MGNVILYLLCLGLFLALLLRVRSSRVGQTTRPWKGKKGLRGGSGARCQRDSHPSALSQPAARPWALSVCWRAAATLSRTVPSSGEGPIFPTLRRPLAKNSPGKSVSSGCFRGVRVRGRWGRASGRCTLRAARGVGLRRSCLCSLGPRPSRARSRDVGGHAVAPGAPTASVRRSRAGPAAELGRKGGSRQPVQRGFSGAASAAVGKPPASPRRWETTARELLRSHQSPGTPLSLAFSPGLGK